MLFVELSVVLFLIALNGFLAMSELAIVSSRRPRLRHLAQQGHAGAQAALELAEHPGRFLSTVQIGITLVGVVAGAFSGATLAERGAEFLEAQGMSTAFAEPLAFVAVVALITYLSLIAGELVPKQIALRNAERVASAVARPMTLLAVAASPLVYLLDGSSRLVLRLLRVGEKPDHAVTDEEIRSLVAEAEDSGVVEPEEKAMISGVMRLADRSVRGIMTHRRDVDWIDLDGDDETIRATVRKTAHSRLPAGYGGIDEVVGIVATKDLLDAMIDGQPMRPAAHIRAAPIIHDRMDSLETIEILKESPNRMAIIVDEYGAFEGIVTTADILQAIAGEFREGGPGEEPAVRRGDGSWLLEGSMPCDEMADMLGITLPEDAEYHTAAGFVLALLKRVPKVGEHIEWAGWIFEVVDMDGRRIDKVLARQVEDG